jgi:hypothetical protein
MALLDLQGLESPTPQGRHSGGCGGGGCGCPSNLSVAVCDGASNLSLLLCD